METSQESIRKRFCRVLEKYSQADVARRTGIPKRSISRYATGTTIPLHIAATLAEKLHIHPNWLLLGIPPEFGVPEQHTSSASEILRELKLVEQIRIGEVDKRPDVKSAKELRDSIENVLRRQELETQAISELLKNTIEQAREQTKLGHFRQAKTLLQLINTLLKISPDQNLQIEASRLESHVAYTLQGPEVALKINRKTAFLSLLHNSTDKHQTVLATLNLSVNLDGLGRVHEALRICQMLQPLDQLDTDSGEYAGDIQMQKGIYELTLGRISAGATLIMDSLKHTRVSDHAQSALTVATAWSSGLPLAEISSTNRDMPWTSYGLHCYALFHGRQDDLLDMQELAPSRETRSPLLEFHTKSVLRALSGQKPLKTISLKSVTDPEIAEQVRSYALHICRAHVACISGNGEVAMSELVKSVVLRASIQNSVLVPLYLRSIQVVLAKRFQDLLIESNSGKLVLIASQQEGLLLLKQGVYIPASMSSLMA